MSANWYLQLKGCATSRLLYLSVIFGFAGGWCGAGGGCTFGCALVVHFFVSDDVRSRSVLPIARCVHAVLLVVEGFSVPVALLRQPPFSMKQTQSNILKRSAAGIQKVSSSS